jgi:uncharacterized membrane protein YuzA (DUF378 family)
MESFWKWVMGLAYTLLVIGGLNWLLIGLFDWNLVTAVFGHNAFARVVYSIIGISTLVALAGSLMKMMGGRGRTRE